MGKISNLLQILILLGIVGNSILFGTDLLVGLGFENIDDDKGIFLSVEPSLDFWQMHLSLGLNIIFKPTLGMILFDVLNKNPSQFFDRFDFFLWDFSYRYGRRESGVYPSSVHPILLGSGGNSSIYRISHEDIFKLTITDSWDFWNFDVQVEKPMKFDVNSYIEKGSELFAGEMQMWFPLLNNLDLIPGVLFDESGFSGFGLDVDYTMGDELNFLVGSSISPSGFTYNTTSVPVKSRFSTRMGVKYLEDIFYFSLTDTSFEMATIFKHEFGDLKFRIEPDLCFKEGELKLNMFASVEYEFVDGWKATFIWDTKDPIHMLKVWISAKVYEQEAEESGTSE